MSTKLLREEKLVEEAIGALLDKLGPVETSRFLSLPHHRKRMDSVRRHQLWQKKLDKEKFFDRVFQEAE